MELYWCSRTRQKSHCIKSLFLRCDPHSKYTELQFRTYDHLIGSPLSHLKKNSNCVRMCVRTRLDPLAFFVSDVGRVSTAHSNWAVVRLVCFMSDRSISFSVHRTI
ncbi:unnamed protein product [Albugo candida]|uniref:Uncharacterized protein n=1 Tax=Albugo candida TaxID=65357 RepID=A0A024G0Z3_9STRA|nr:unnamed protein product [Albugo candida]|eukprot:CCI40241.1 unnamed protein product [Albugo candida]